MRGDSNTENGGATASFAISYTRYLRPDGTLEGELPAFAQDPKELIPLYRMMVLTRALDEKAVALQRTGRLGTYASSLGQEAVGVGVAAAMRADDVLIPSFREQSAQLWRGVTPTEILLYWGGDERGSDFAGPRQDFPVCIPVATHVPHAAGVALAFQLRNEPRVAVCVTGDGGTSKGDFYEAINIAGVWNLPAVFIVNNNQWAISVPRSEQTAAETLAQKAIAAGIPGEQVDGNDVIAVRDAAERAIARARDGGGSSLIEAVTYRLSDHTTADDARRYREDAEVSARWKDEPVSRLRRYLVDQGVWAKDDEEALLTESSQTVDRAADEYLATPAGAVTDMFDFLYAELPADLVDQRETAASQTDGGGDG
jgi:pyruvate dehydrogenase E1 component alpha subunit